MELHNLRLYFCALIVVCCLTSTNGQQKTEAVKSGRVIVFGKPPKTFNPVQQTIWNPQSPEVEALDELIPRLDEPASINGPVSQLIAQPKAGRREFIPLPKGKPDAEIEFAGTADSVSLSTSGADISAVLKLIADKHHLNLVLGPSVTGPITVSISDATREEVLDAILAVGGFTWHQNGSLLYVTSLNTEESLDPRVQGKEVRVFPLNYVSAPEVERIVIGLLSPAGQAFVSESNAEDQKRTQELLVVEDVPSGIARIRAYLDEVDRAPKQVLIEAHVMQVTLDDELRHGVNLASLAEGGRG